MKGTQWLENYDASRDTRPAYISLSSSGESWSGVSRLHERSSTSAGIGHVINHNFLEECKLLPSVDLLGVLKVLAQLRLKLEVPEKHSSSGERVALEFIQKAFHVLLLFDAHGGSRQDLLQQLISAAAPAHLVKAVGEAMDAQRGMSLLTWCKVREPCCDTSLFHNLFTSLLCVLLSGTVFQSACWHH